MYTQEDFKGCFFNPLEPNIFKKYPRLSGLFEEKEYSEKEEDENFFLGKKNELVKYIICVYDPLSPFVRDYQDLIKRKQMAETFVEFEAKQFIDSLINCTSEVVYTVTHNFLKNFLRSMEWAKIVALEYKFWEAVGLVMQPITGATDKEQLEASQKKKLLGDGLQSDIEAIQSGYRSFYGLDEKLVEQKKKIRYTPEDIARVTKERENNVR